MKRMVPVMFLAATALAAFFVTRLVAGSRTVNPAVDQPRIVQLDSEAAPASRDRGPMASGPTRPPSAPPAGTPIMAAGRQNVPVGENCGTIEKVPDSLIERTPFKNRGAFNAFVTANKTKIAGLQMSVDTAMRERVDAARDCVYRKHPQAPRMTMHIQVEFNMQATPSSIGLSSPAVTTPASSTVPKADLDECLRPVLQPLQINDSGDLYFDYSGPYPYKLVI